MQREEEMQLRHSGETGRDPGERRERKGRGTYCHTCKAGTTAHPLGLPTRSPVAQLRIILKEQ